MKAELFVNRVAFLALITKDPKDIALPFMRNFRLWQKRVGEIWERLNETPITTDGRIPRHESRKREP